MWRIGETEPFARFDWGGASLLVTWSPEGRRLVTGDQTPSVHLCDFTRDCPLHIQGYETKVKAMDFSPDGKRLATGGGAKVTVWNCTGKTGPEDTIPDQLKFHKGDVETIAWSPTGEFLATGDVAGRLVFSDTKGRPVSAFEDAEGISARAWSPDGEYLAAGVARGRVALFSD
jgi:WD40 repeat protein